MTEVVRNKHIRGFDIAMTKAAVLEKQTGLRYVVKYRADF